METKIEKTQIADLEPAPFVELSDEQLQEVSGGETRTTGSGSIAWSDSDPPIPIPVYFPQK